MASVHLEEIDMPDFMEFQLNARKLTEKITGTLKKSPSSVGCLTFFKEFTPDKRAESDLCIISMVANSLDESNDLNLMRYLQNKKDHSLLTLKEFMEFKTKTLVGCYLLKWRQYDRYIYKSVLEQFKNDLNITSLSDLSDEYIDSCLATFSQFCSFVYENHTSSIYSNLYKQLGDSIQVDIHSARYPTTTATSLVFDVVHAGMQTIGIKY